MYYIHLYVNHLQYIYVYISISIYSQIKINFQTLVFNEIFVMKFTPIVDDKIVYMKYISLFYVYIYISLSLIHIIDFLIITRCLTR